jgi:sodium transport system permease protein
LSPVRHVFRKETREMLRDKRVISSAFVGPVFLIVIFLFLFGFLQQTLTKPQAQTLHVVSSPAAEALAEKLETGGRLQIAFVPTASEGERLIREGQAKALLEVPENVEERLSAGETARLKVRFDPDKATAPLVLRELENWVTAASKELVNAALGSAGLQKELAEPIRLEREEIQKEKAVAGSLIVGLLPYLIVIWAFYGGFSVVTDLAAGEKEKFTLETLLIAPVSRAQIALGKFWALFVVCLVSSLTSFVTVLIVGSTGLEFTKPLFPDGVHLTLGSLLAFLGALLPLVALFAAVLLAISAYARNTREAQTHLTLASFVVLMPAIFSQFIGFTEFGDEWWISLIPILNTADVIRESLLGKLDGMALILTVLSSLVLAAIALAISVRMFRREEVLATI